MTIKDLISLCENIKPEMDMMIYNSLEDYMNDTPFWNSCRVESIAYSDAKIARFKVYDNMVVVALA